ncbi:DUF3800 domain-containing protein [Allosphingosinicella flava]|uniref:DUF3800 domain-containing protein n=1 Tax=Allosphingosinicella flava TaxID=2771430 RepID=A0A7T2GKC6_9SPHN|nr:DUF3800 domain-containing protein [Sphingosinicella flava]QPQ55098.1 DUF3800 domain-containing protein [Sphingosinicella flava]
MHFFYLDESGCTGGDLQNNQQPIFVLGGISVKDQGWRETTDRFRSCLTEFFGGDLPDGFELHATDLVNGEGPFEQYDREQRAGLIHELLDLITDRKHPLHLVAIDKAKLGANLNADAHPVVDCSVPYLLGFNYLVTYIERYAKQVLGRTVRAMIILDQKDAYQARVDAITAYRRYDVPQARRLKWLVEFSYPVDSVRHPMIQLSDLVIFLARKFLEVDNGYREGWSPEAKNFFASCYAKIVTRIKWTTLLPPPGPEDRAIHRILNASVSTHRRNWRQRYNLEG